MPPLAWYALILVIGTDLGSAANTASLLGELVRLVWPEASPESLALANLVLRKTGHALGYGVLALVIRPAVRGSARLAFAVTVLGAALDEALQLTTRSRTGAAADVALDAAGAAVALAVTACLRRSRESAMSRALSTRTLMLLLVAFAATGCAPSLPYRLDLNYQPPAAAPVAGQPLVVALAEARDARDIADRAAIGRRITAEGAVEPMVAAGDKAERIITDAIHARLVALGYPVRRVAAWDGTPESLDPTWGDAVIGAEVLEFWTEARTEPLKPTTIATRARIRLVLADPKARRVVWTNTVESASEQDVVRFSEGAATRNANEALGGAIRGLVENPDLAERLAAMR